MGEISVPSNRLQTIWWYLFFLGQATHWVLKGNFIYLFLTRKQNKYFWNMSCVSVKRKPEGNWHCISMVMSLRAKFKATCHCSRKFLIDWSRGCSVKALSWRLSRSLPSVSCAFAVICTISMVSFRPALSSHESRMRSHSAPMTNFEIAFLVIYKCL